MSIAPTMIREPASGRTMILLAGVLMATSSLVFIEPAPYDLLLLVLLAGCLAAGLPIPREIRLPALLLGCFLVGNLVAAILAPEPLETLRSTSIRIYMVLSWLFFVCLVAGTSGRALPALWTGYLIAAAAAVAFGILEYYGYVEGIGREGGLRARGPFKDPNVFGPFLVPVAVYCVYRLRRAAGLTAALWLGLFLVLAAGILLSFSRGAWLNFAVATGLFVGVSIVTSRSLREKLGWLLVSGLVVLAASLVVVGTVTWTTAADRFADRAVLAKQYDLKEGGRFYTQQLALQRSGRSPLGIGPGRTDEVFGLEPHNLYLHVLVEGGWLAGLALYGFIAFTLWRSALALGSPSPERGEGLVVFASLAGALVQSAFIDSTHWRHLWFLMALMWGFIVLTRRGTATGLAASMRIGIRDPGPVRPPQRPRMMPM